MDEFYKYADNTEGVNAAFQDFQKEYDIAIKNFNLKQHKDLLSRFKNLNLRYDEVVVNRNLHKYHKLLRRRDKLLHLYPTISKLLNFYNLDTVLKDGVVQKVRSSIFFPSERNTSFGKFIIAVDAILGHNYNLNNQPLPPVSDILRNPTEWDSIRNFIVAHGIVDEDLTLPGRDTQLLHFIYFLNEHGYYKLAYTSKWSVITEKWRETIKNWQNKSGNKPFTGSPRKYQNTEWFKEAKRSLPAKL